MRTPIYVTIERQFDKIQIIWTAYKNGDLSGDELGVKLNEATGATHSMEHWHRTLTAVDLGMSRNPDIAEILTAKKQRSMELVKMNRQVKQLAFYELTRDAIVECIKDEPSYSTHLDIYEWMKEPRTQLSNGRVAIVSDIHYQGFDSDLHNLMVEMRDEGLTEVIFNGDIIQGYLRESDLYNPVSSPIEQLQNFVAIVTPYLKEMHEQGLKKVVIMPGNHDEHRLMKQIIGDMNKSFDELLAFMLQLSIPTLDIIYSATTTVEHRDKDWLVVHGNGHRGEKALRDYYISGGVMYGHYHNYKVDDRFVSLPAACRSNSYEKFLGIPNSETAGFVVVTNSIIEYRHFKVGDNE